jgi:hypothetical protein
MLGSLSGKEERVGHGGGFNDRRATALVGLDDLATRVVAAVRTDVVGAVGPSALRAWLERHRAEREVGATPPLAPLGELYLG